MKFQIVRSKHPTQPYFWRIVAENGQTVAATPAPTTVSVVGLDHGSRRFGPLNRYITSRIDGWCSSSMITRDSPIPKPPCGGTP